MAQEWTGPRAETVERPEGSAKRAEKADDDETGYEMVKLPFQSTFAAFSRSRRTSSSIEATLFRGGGKQAVIAYALAAVDNREVVNWAKSIPSDQLDGHSANVISKKARVSNARKRGGQYFEKAGREVTATRKESRETLFENGSSPRQPPLQPLAGERLFQRMLDLPEGIASGIHAPAASRQLWAPPDPSTEGSIAETGHPEAGRESLSFDALSIMVPNFDQPDGPVSYSFDVEPIMSTDFDL
ncbi:hypothetical protein F4680DRAFT_447947 [Xylaria scruposa]|nr:hypothetical protein F4680DRAFT_447947 [Xylaria scruposa]